MRLSEYPWVVVRLDCKLCPRRGQYRLARLAANLWPQPAPDYHVKDRLEFALCSYVCEGKVPLAQAQREIAEDSIGTAKRYLQQ